MILKVILKMFFAKFDLALAPSFPLSTNILFFFLTGEADWSTFVSLESTQNIVVTYF